MLRHKVLIQGIRVAFGITGIYDPDEAERIIDAQIAEQPQGKPEVAMPQEKVQPAIEQKEPSLISEAQVKRLYAIAKASKYADEEVKVYLLKNYGIDSSKKIAIEYYDAIVEHFQAAKSE
jgi:hypothetical protein